MFRNVYDSAVEPWKVQLIARRARRKGFLGADLEDAQQEIILDVMAFQFDPEKSNGATEVTALTALIDRRLSTLRRTRQRYEKRFARPADEEALLNGNQYEDQGQLVIDVRGVLEDLSPSERLLCRALADGQSIRQIAKQRGCSWHTVQRQVANIRATFEAQGLSYWLTEGV